MILHELDITFEKRYNLAANCGGSFFVSDENVTTITSPGFPNGYDNNLECTWTLTADPHYRVALTLITLDMEAGFCQFDRVEIADGGIQR